MKNFDELQSSCENLEIKILSKIEKPLISFTEGLILVHENNNTILYESSGLY